MEAYLAVVDVPPAEVPAVDSTIGYTLRELSADVVADLRKLGKVIRRAEDDGIRARWEVGKLLLPFRRGRHNLPAGMRVALSKLLHVAQSDVTAFLCLAEKCPDETSFATARSEYGTWTEIRDQFLRKTLPTNPDKPRRPRQPESLKANRFPDSDQYAGDTAHLLQSPGAHPPAVIDESLRRLLASKLYAGIDLPGSPSEQVVRDFEGLFRKHLDALRHRPGYTLGEPYEDRAATLAATEFVVNRILR